MLSLENSRRALTKLFRKQTIADLNKLYEALETNSRMSVFRRLKDIGYISSYTHAGRYYTLSEIPKFDKWGLWFFRNIGFSSAGTLKATVIHLVESSSSGMTAKEMHDLLHLPVANALHNTLRELVEREQIQGQRQKGRNLYLNIFPKKAQEQYKRREEEQMAKPSLPEIGTIIQVLLEALHVGRRVASPEIVSSRLKIRGIIVSPIQILQIYEHYGLKGKKN